MKKIKVEDLVLDIIIYTTLTLLTIVCAYPVWYVIVASFSNTTDLALNQGLLLWPREFDFGGYMLVFRDKSIVQGFINSVLVLVLSLPINIVLTLFCGYFLSCTNMFWKKILVNIIMFTMMFHGGMIPAYLNVRDLGLYNTIWALVLPGALSVYNAVICKTAIEGVPDSLKESAYIDGASDWVIIFKIIMPLIKATLAVLLMYYGVAHWNAWFNASIYLKEERLLPLQNIIRNLLISNSVADADDFNAYAETIKYSAIVVSTVPIMCVYPFLQKHFTKGIMIGAVKG